MYFLTQSQNISNNIYRIINATSWSNCLSYLEGTGEIIQQINSLPDSVSVLANSPSSTNCYNVRLREASTGESFSYIIFQENYSDLQNWISQQTGKNLTQILFSEKTYVNV